MFFINKKLLLACFKANGYLYQVLLMAILSDIWGCFALEIFDKFLIPFTLLYW